MNGFLLMAVILLPIALGILCLLAKNAIFRNILIVLTSVAITAISVYFAYSVLINGKMVFSFNEMMSKVGVVITILDFVLLAYIVYIGFKHKRTLIILLGLLQAVPLAIFELKSLHGAEPELSFVIDNLSVIMLLVISIVGGAIAIFGIGYMKKHEHHLHLPVTRQPRFFAVILIFLGIMNALVVTNNIMWMYFFWEVTTLCSFLLISHDKNEESINNALRALLLNSLGGVAFVAGIITVFFACDTIAIDQILVKGSGMQLLLLIPMSFFCFAGFTKAAQFPFQSWLLGAMVAPTPVSALLHSSTMVKAGVFLIIRFSPVFAGTMLGNTVAIVGAFTFLAGSAIAISQSNAKRVLAYSTIANLGLIICCAGFGNALGIAIAVILTVMHAISKGLMFLCVGTIEQDIESRDIEDMQGIMNKMPYTATIMAFGMISMLLPPFGVFMTKWLAIEASADSPLVLLMLVLGSACTVVFWAKWIGSVMTMTHKKKFVNENLPFSISITLGFLVILVFCVSILVVPMYSNFVEPYVASTVLNDGNGSNVAISKFLMPDRQGLSWFSNNNFPSGSFPVVSLFGLFLLILLFLPIFFNRIQDNHFRKPYMCGENADDIEDMQAFLPGDKVESVVVRNYYLSGLFSEEKLTVSVNILAIVVILVMFGVVFNV